MEHPVVPIRGMDMNGAEVSWFAPLCSDDYQFLGVPDGGCDPPLPIPVP